MGSWLKRSLCHRHCRRCLLSLLTLLVLVVKKNRNNNTSVAFPADGPSPPSSSGSRIYCMVPFLWNLRASQTYRAMRDTWGKRCDVLRIFVDPIIGGGGGNDDGSKSGGGPSGFFNLTSNKRVIGPSGVTTIDVDANVTLPSDVVVLHDMKRPWHTCDSGDCRNIWEKVWRSLLWIGNSVADVNSADWFVKIDSDTFLFPENLRRYVEKKDWSPDDRHYFGHRVMHTDRPGQAPIIAGAAAIFSRAAVKGLASIFRGFEPFIENTNVHNCLDAHLGTGEEIITAICLKKYYNVSAYHALDSDWKELISILPIGRALTMKRANALAERMVWYWKRKPKRHPVTGKLMHICCSNMPIALHGYKDPRLLYQIEEEVYGTANLSHSVLRHELWTIYGPDPNRTLDYFGRVRAAMNENKMFRLQKKRREGG